MLPPVHPGIAYLLYALYTRVVDDDPPTGLVTLALLLGAVLPDLVDLPLYYLGGAPSTRTVGHSLFVGIGLSALVGIISRRSTINNYVGVAFAVGYFSHLLADAVWPLVLRIPEELRYLGWPLTQQPVYDGIKPLVTVGGTTVTTVWVELALLMAAIVLWWRDGQPGLQWRSSRR